MRLMTIYHPDHSGQLNLAIPPWVGYNK